MKPGPKPLPPEKKKKPTNTRFSRETLRHAEALSKLLELDRTAVFERSVDFVFRAVRSGELDPEELLAATDGAAR